MNSNCFRIRRGGFTHWDAIVVALFAALLVVAGLLLPRLAKPRRVSAPRIHCVNNLKQVGLAYRMWSNDHNDQFPQSLSTNEGGALEFGGTEATFEHFLALSNELVTPKVLVCPADRTRKKTHDWTELSNLNLSYFVGLDANEARPQSILSGDRNVVGGGQEGLRVWEHLDQVEAGWGNDLHNGHGNVGMGDGSVSQLTGPGLKRQIQGAIRESTNRVRVQLPLL